VDKWGPHGSNSSSDPDYGLRVVNELIDLQGYNNTVATGQMDVEPVLAIGGTQASKRAWWAFDRGGNIRALNDTRARFQDKTGAATTIPDATIYDAATGSILTPAALASAGMCDSSGNPVLNRVVRGTHHAWMTRADGQPVITRKVKIAATMTYTEYDCQSAQTNFDPTYLADHDRSGNHPVAHNNIEHTVNIELTNAVPNSGASGVATFTTVATSTAGEAYVIGAGGIAQYLYQQMNVLQFEGSHVQVAAQFGAGVSLGQTINLSGGATLWTTMAAQPQEISRHYGTHETSVRIGVARHLNSGQLSALLNMWRFRRVWYNPLMRTNNANAGVGGTVAQPVTAGNSDTVPGIHAPVSQAYNSYATPPSGTTPGVIANTVIIDSFVMGFLLAV
jgi:hypothetical protein